MIAVSDGKDLDGESDPAVDATVEVTVSVIDVNEPPALSGPSAVEFLERSGDSVGAYAAVDPDGDEVSWSVGGADAASFEISAEGVLRFLSPPDFEAPGDADGDNAYQVQVRVTDGKDTAGEPDAAVDATVEMTVSVTDVNEPPALSGPSAVEFVEGGDDSVGAYAAVDPDGDEVSWSVGGADAASFEISAEGVLRFLSPPDFEAPGDADGDNAYQVQVRVTDGKDTAGEPDAAVDATVEVTVSVTDVAEWSVVAVPARVAEGAVSTVTVSVDKAFEVDQTITLTATGGTAASGDYSLSSLSLTLGAGDMSVTASVTAVDDSVIDGGDETVVVTASHGGGAVGSATVTIEDNDTAVWSVVAVPARVAEGAVSTVTVSVDKAFEVDQTITLAAMGGTAASGDYSLSSLSLTLGAGDMSVTASVTAVDDSVIDGGDETVVVTASHGDETVGSATVTIEDNDTAVWSVAAVPARVVEGAVSTVTVSVDKEFEVDQTITLAATGGTAASGDYSLSPLSLTLVAGDMSVTASVTAVDDSVIDGGDETVVVTASHGDETVGSATVTIEDNDTAVWSVAAVPARVVEGAVSTVTVSVDKEFEVDQTITLTATGGTAASGDYSLSPLSLTLDAGDTSVTASVTAVDDSDEESDETVVVTASHGDETVGSATVTIEANDTPTWSVVAVPARVAEGAVSTVTVSVDKEFEADQTITLAATGGTAASGDYSLSPLSLTLGAGDMSVTASVTAVDDSVIDGGDETVVVTASHGGGAVGSATVTIEDNDTPTWSVVAVPARVAEGAVSTVTVSVDKEFEVDQTITLAATGGTAASGDYSLSPTLSLTLVAGDMSVTASVTAVDDSVIDGGDETVVVTASHGDETVGSATVTIEDNDTPTWSVVAVPARVVEGAVSTVTVSVDKEFSVDQTITLAATGTAASGDYSLSPTLSLTLDAGDTSVTASVTAVDDSVIDGGDETVVVTASHGGGAVGSATVTIEDNDTAVWSVAAVPARVVEGAASTVTVSVDKEFEVDQTITLAATGGTAASGDYSLSSLSLTLVAGDTSVTASVTAVDDSDEESDETVVVTASHGDGAVGSATVTIEDNDTAAVPVVSSASALSVVEGDTVVATLSATDADTDVGDLVWSVAGGVDALEFSLSASGVLAFSAAKDFEAPDDADGDGTYEVTVRVSDGARAATADVEVSLANRNEAPTADAGADQSGVAMGATVALAGSGADPDADDVLAYAWTQTSGDSVTLVDVGAATASFDAPGGLTYDATLVFTLTVTDAGGLSHQDQVSITVEAAEVLLSSDGQVEVTIEVVDGDLNYSVALGETMLLARSAVGLAFSDDVDAVSDVTVVGRSRRDVDTTWTPVWGKSAEVVDRFSEITVQLQETATAARRFDVVFRAYDDGVAFRYSLASQDNLADGDTVRERTEFNVAANWPIHSVGRVERPPAGPTLSDDFATSRTPALVLADSGVFAIHEAGLLDYPELRLSGNGEKSHSLLADVNSVSFSGSLLTPWRVLMVATEIGELLETQILETLSPSVRISDPSFIQPGRAIWDWRVRKLTYGDVNYGVNTATYIHMIDFAAENNIAYLAIDAGWYGSERSAASDPTTAIDGLDIAAVLAHAEDKGVRVILYINDRAFDNHVMEDVFETWSQWGVAGVKYGFMGGTFYSQDRVVRTVTAIETAAEHRLLINFHDSPVHPTGLQRTYPNLITVEYALAQHDDVRAFSPVDFLRTIFVNMLAGPLDMNNGFFDLNDITRKTNSRPGNDLQYPEIYSTVATEVARTLITNTGLTVLPDAAEAYLEKDGMFEFIRQMPNARWDETRVLNAEFGEHVTVAKRHGRDWFVGSVIDESGGSLDIDLGFLDSATTYAATIYGNASDSHYMTNREVYDVAQTVVTASDTLTAVMAPGGGHAVWLRPETGVEFTSPDVFEMAENGTLAGRVTAEESGSQYRISGYTLTGGADETMFEISDDGALSFISSADYEQPADAANANEYVVTVEATGTHNTVAQTASQTITVRVLDVDDTPTWSVVAVPARVVEGAVSTVTVSVDKAFEVDQTITLADDGHCGERGLFAVVVVVDAGRRGHVGDRVGDRGGRQRRGKRRDRGGHRVPRRRRGRFGDGHHRSQRHAGLD